MSIIEWLANGGRRCECGNLVLHFTKIIYYSTITSSNWLKDYIKMATGTARKKKQTRWSARCSQCNALYLSTYTKKRMIECLEFVKIKYKELK